MTESFPRFRSSVHLRQINRRSMQSELHHRGRGNRVTGHAVAIGEAAGVTADLAAWSTRMPHEFTWSRCKTKLKTMGPRVWLRLPILCHRAFFSR
uniref:hypothetical protein n=1 Tax=Prosthecobacter sp. TaxID=1965333 RepID=UPI0037845771